MGRPPSDLDDYLDWQQRLENQKASGLSVDDFCLQEDISKSTFYRWADRLREGIPESIAGEPLEVNLGFVRWRLVLMTYGTLLLSKSSREMRHN